MGLDWCLKNQIREGCEAKAKRVQGKMNALDARLDKKWKDKHPSDKAWKEYKAAKRELDDEMATLVITPAQAIGAPRVGVDKRATEWFRDNVWKPNHDMANDKDASNPEFAKFWSRTFEECLEEEYGKYVIELAEDKYDKSTCTGFFTAPTSFRGKCVGYDENIGEALQNEAYEDHDAAGCIDYGNRLIRAACNNIRLSCPTSTGDMPMEEMTDEQILARYDELRAKGREIAKADPPKGPFEGSDAKEKWEESLPETDKRILGAWAAFDGARWLIFWGGKGFGYWAWY